MNCSKTRDLLLTGYIDGEISPAEKNAVDAHLSVCRECSYYKEKVLREVKEPFKDTAAFQCPPEAWVKIRQGINNEKNAVSALPGFVSNIFRVMRPVRTVYAFAAAMAVAMILFLSHTGVNDRSGNIGEFLDNEVDFMASLENSDTSYWESNV